MKIVFITINDLYFLPRFYENFFSKANSRDIYKILLVSPLYKDESTLSMAIRYFKTFGAKEFTFFTLETAIKKISERVQPPKSSHKPISVKSVLVGYGIEAIRIRGDVNASSVLRKLRNWGTDLIISVGCPQIFKKDLIRVPRLGCLNLHGAPLPHYRGILPSFWMLKNSEKHAANTLFFVNESIDGGDIILQEMFSIREDDNLRSLIMRSKLHASEMVLKAIEMIGEGGFKTSPIDTSMGSYYGWPTKIDVKEFLRQGCCLR